MGEGTEEQKDIPRVEIYIDWRNPTFCFDQSSREVLLVLNVCTEGP